MSKCAIESMECPLCGKNFHQSFECDHDEYDLIKRIAELEAQAAWRPIETAPKDEMVMFAFDEAFFGTFTKEMQIGYYDSESEEWRFSLNERKVVGRGVTHWMPLPEPPQESGHG